MDKRIRQIVVLGGGTAGWMSALFLRRALMREGGPPLDVTLVESARIGIIGVGESTLPSLRHTLSALGVDEAEMMAFCSATFKLGICFANWSVPPAPDHYWHMFADQVPMVEGLPVWHAWLWEQRNGGGDSFVDRCFEAVDLCYANKAPKTVQEANYSGSATYAYHLDARLLGEFLRIKAVAAGVRHVVDEVLEVKLDERGHIAALVTAVHGDLSGDLFIDCSGFRARLISQALGEPFDSFSDCLFCDRAVATTVALAPDAPLVPYTRSTAMSAGWIWDIPLQSRRGVGYVYSSAHCTDQQAQTELLGYLGLEDHDRPIHYLPMRVGRTRNSWVGNCIAIGLAGGFVEPLEASGIFTIEVALRELWQSFPDRDFHPGLSRKFNENMRLYYDNIRDFLVLHYCLSRRQDTEFWRLNSAHPALPASLRRDLDKWRDFLPMFGDIAAPRLFAEFSYVSILAGMDAVGRDVEPLPVLTHSGTHAIVRGLDAIDARRRLLRTAMPDHGAYLAALKRASNSSLAEA